MHNIMDHHKNVVHRLAGFLLDLSRIFAKAPLVVKGCSVHLKSVACSHCSRLSKKQIQKNLRMIVWYGVENGYSSLCKKRKLFL